MRFRTRGGEIKSLGVAGKLVSTVFLGVFLAAGLFFFGLLSQEIWQTGQTYLWKSTECRIVSSEVVRSEARENNPYEFRVRFSYDWEGRTYTVEKAGLKDAWYGSYDKARKHVHEFPAGERANCWVNPQQPTQAVLVRGSFWVVPFLVIPLIFIVVGGGGIIAVWRAGSGTPTDNTTNSGPISERATKKSSAGCLIPFFGLFFLAGAGFFYGFFIRPAWQILQARDWVQTPCVVEASDVQSHRGDDGTTYSVDILYRYEVDGKEFRSSRYDFRTGSSSGYQSKRAIVRRYPAGQPAICYVDPQDPQQAVLERGWTAAMWFGLIPLVFVVVGAGGMFMAFRSPRRAGSAASANAPALSGAADWVSAPHRASTRSGSTPLGDETMETGPVELKAKHSPLGKLIGVIVFSVFWNGIVSVFVWQVIRGWQRKNGGFMEKWLLPVFLIPFVLIGLFMIVAVFHQALALFNARPRLRVNSRTVRLGEALEVAWVLEGRIAPMERLEIVLEGQEEATYRRGTRSSTDKHVFKKLVLANVTASHEMKSGSARLSIPENTMHSFESTHNKIMWTLRVKGQIRRWPDIDDQFAIRILPCSSAG